MHCELCEKIRDLVALKVTKSLREQHAILSEHQIESLIDFEIDKMAEKLITLLDHTGELTTMIDEGHTEKMLSASGD